MWHILGNGMKVHEMPPGVTDGNGRMGPYGRHGDRSIWSRSDAAEFGTMVGVGRSASGGQSAQAEWPEPRQRKGDGMSRNEGNTKASETFAIPHIGTGHPVGSVDIDRSRMAARKRNRSRMESSVTYSDRLHDSLATIARLECRNYSGIEADEVHMAALHIMGTADVGTDRHSAYRRIMEGSDARNDLATFRMVCRQYVTRESERMAKHESFETLAMVDTSGHDMTYRPLRGNGAMWAEEFAPEPVRITLHETERVFAVKSDGTTKERMQFVGPLPAMETVSAPTLATIAGAYRADGRYKKADRDAAKRRVDTHDVVSHGMAQSAGMIADSVRPEFTMRPVKESGNGDVTMDRFGQFTVHGSDAPFVSILAETPLDSLLASPIFRIMGGELPRHDHHDEWDRKAMTEWSDRFFVADAPTDSKAGKAIAAAIDRFDMMRSTPMVAGTVRSLPVEIVEGNDDFLGIDRITSAATLADAMVTMTGANRKGSNAERRYVMDWQRMATIVYRRNLKSDSGEVKGLRRYFQALASDTGADLSTARSIFGRIETTEENKRTMTFLRCRPVIRKSETLRSEMFRNWSGRMHVIQSMFFDTYNAAMRAAIGAEHRSRYSEFLRLSIEWGVSATFRDEHSRMAAYHAAGNGWIRTGSVRDGLEHRPFRPFRPVAIPAGRGAFRRIGTPSAAALRYTGDVVAEDLRHM